ncbi:MAG: tyrosine--tRNA ligase [Spirochaetales bacterium]|nr:tyrosine--tRNA ligase [Spirochaetales bacterium]
MMAGLEELRARDFIQQCTNIDGLEKLLESDTVSFYCGFDPTGPSLHVGHLVPLFAMAHLNRAGHRPIALVGGGTALIGDPSGKTEMRKMQTKEQIASNAQSIKNQIAKFIDFDGGSAIMVDNYEWLGGLNYIDFLRDIGRHFSVNRMLSFETYKMRLETGLSFIEFNYQLLQSYDFLTLYQREGCRLQVGGDDQWGNIVSGADLTRRIEGVEVYGLTFPLVARSDGKKMGKTEKGSLFLDPGLTPPYEFFQYWRNVADPDVEKFLKLYTFLPLEQIKELSGLKDSEINRAKEVLAYELTAIVHGKETAEKAREAAAAAFSSAAGSTDAIPSIEIPRSEIEAGIQVLDLFSRTNLCSSRSEARRLVVQGGASVNDKKVEEVEAVIDAGWVEDGVITLKAGKKRFFQIRVV